MLSGIPAVRARLVALCLVAALAAFVYLCTSLGLMVYVDQKRKQ